MPSLPVSEFLVLAALLVVETVVIGTVTYVGLHMITPVAFSW
jgi:hypothetical protein